MINLKESKIIRKIIGILLDILILGITILIIIGIYYLYQVKIQKNNYANIFGYTFFEVATGSMANTINIGDVVIVKITKKVNENDIIVYQDENNFITHRLIEKNGDELKTKGDANNSEDTPVEMVQVLWKVEKIIPKIGIWKKVFMSPQMLGLISAFVAFLGIIINRFSKNNNIEWFYEYQIYCKIISIKLTITNL